MKTVVITGVSSGIGKETAIKFASTGWTVYGAVRDANSAKVKEFQQLITDKNLPVKIGQCDVQSDAQIENFINEITSQTNSIDVLINNAGYGYLGPIECLDLDNVKQQFDVNVYGSLRMMQKIVPIMRKQQSGLIINISSVNGLVPFPLYGAYSASKYALEALSEILHYEVTPFNIKVAVVEPGYFKTDFNQNIEFAKNVEKSVYATWAEQTKKRLLSKTEFKGGLLSKLTDSTNVANLLFKIANSKTPRLRYKMGLDTYVYTVARRILPYEIWVKLINIVFKWH